VAARDYHEATKHHFQGFARSLGYLDWATQPAPFRRFAGAPVIALPRAPARPDVAYAALYDRSLAPAPVTDHTVGELLRCGLGLSAWKRYGDARWALRVNPSSGNLHPTEGYLLRDGRVAHYAPDGHALETRSALSRQAWEGFVPPGGEGVLVALTSIAWREAWKYGERAYRYCQHDVGHALGALRLAAALLGWRLCLLPRWSDAALARVIGVDRADDFVAGEREAPACVAVATPGDPAVWLARDPAPLVAAAGAATWHGTANRLSPAHVPWPAIDAVDRAAAYPGGEAEPADAITHASQSAPFAQDAATGAASARAWILQRRSAVAFDGTTSLRRDVFLSMLDRQQPSGTPRDAIGWPPQVHLALFVHRVDGLPPGLYAATRDEGTAAEWRAAMRGEFLWEPRGPRLWLLAPMGLRQAAREVSCNQEIASDGFFSLGMIARFGSSLASRGDWFYRRLFWECGLVGQVLYLEAEAVGARATGIGCFFDDPVHDLLGLDGDAWQSLYHFSMGVPVEDRRLTTEPGYAWDA
jgi:SagB-type dehydrogenase family enzyme